MPIARAIAHLIVCLLLLFLLATFARAQAPVVVSGMVPARLEMAVGRSMVLQAPGDVERVALSAPDAADILLLSSRQIYLSAKKAGAVNLTVWGKGDHIVAIYELAVTPDVVPLKEVLHRVLPEEKGIRVQATGESVTVSGTATSPAAVTQALALAESYAPKKVINLLTVGGVQQVMLEVRVAEMTRTLARRLGINLYYAFKGQLLTSTFLNGLTIPQTDGSVFLSENVNGQFRILDGSNTWTGFIDALKENGVIKILAEPNLVCLSGEKADFLAGGEIPVPVPSGLGTVSIEWKPFGVGLAFRPTVLGGSRISIEVKPEVSELDYSNKIEIQGFTIPAIRTRRATTMVELDSGQSFAIAGLINDNMREANNRFPVLGDVPVLGTLFSSKSYQRNETELVIIITPHLAKPMDQTVQTLPTDGFMEPNDVEYYLYGDLEGGRFQSRPVAAAVRKNGGAEGGFDGQYGSAMPGNGGK